MNINGGAYDETNLIGVAYVVEQATKLHKTPAEVDPAEYRCARTTPAEPFASRGHCNPDYLSIVKETKGTTKTVLPFSLETTSAKTLETMMGEGTLSARELVQAELYRIALTNANGPGAAGRAQHQPERRSGSDGDRQEP